MKPYLEQYTPTSIPEEARPTPSPPIVEGAENISSDSENELAVHQAAEAAGGKLLHNYLLTSNKPPLPNPEEGKILLIYKYGPKASTRVQSLDCMPQLSFHFVVVVGG